MLRPFPWNNLLSGELVRGIGCGFFLQLQQPWARMALASSTITPLPGKTLHFTRFGIPGLVKHSAFLGDGMPFLGCRPITGWGHMNAVLFSLRQYNRCGPAAERW